MTSHTGNTDIPPEKCTSTPTTKFSWKRKTGERVSLTKSTQFSQQAADDDDVTEEAIADWFRAKRQCLSLEDGIAKSGRLKNEGITLAEADRNWEALKKWDEALIYTPDNETIHEMKAQVYMDLHEVEQAVLSAERAVLVAPTWWIAHQTLGRAQLSTGHVHLAKLSFSRAIFLNPDNTELWNDDLEWTLSLIKRKSHMNKKFEEEKQQSSKATITELRTGDGEQLPRLPQIETETESAEETRIDLYTSKQEWTSCSSVNKLPQNYVLMR